MKRNIELTRREALTMGSALALASIVGAASGAGLRAGAARAPAEGCAKSTRDGWRADPAVCTLIMALRFGDGETRRAAVERALLVGSPAVAPLCEVVEDADRDAARAAKRALDRIVRHCSRSGAEGEAASCAAQLAAFGRARYDAAVRAETRCLSGVA
jgi:hypothetical protein